MTTSYSKYLVTSALPYANGPLHFGHLSGVYIPSDIYVRHRRMQGQRVVHICGSDEHGVAIMISAEKEGLDYKSYVNKWHAEHKELFKRFEVDFDFFGRTSEPYHKDEVLVWFDLLYKNGFIGKASEKQLYCIDDKRFLPDRYVEGTCYVCNYPNARGDECPNCGEWIDPTRLKNPVSKISGSRNIEVREAEHYYLLLKKMETEFRKWFATKEKEWRPVVTGFVKGLLEAGLIDRAISRDLEWGIDVPLAEAKGKKLYVWFDAPIGYVSNTKQWLKETGSKEDYLKDWWDADGVEISHFIGKDNIIFHAFIWPCMIMGSRRTHMPTEVPANQFVNLEGKQFSKSSGWYIDARKAVDTFGADSLRFYLSGLIPETGDSSFSWNDFASAHEELGNKFGNFINRALTFIEKYWPDGLPAEAFDKALGHPELAKIKGFHDRIIASLDQFEFTKARAELILFAQSANEFFQAQAPWKAIKTDQNLAAEILALSTVYIAIMGTLISPFVPGLSRKMLAHFEGYLSEEAIRKIYSGDYAPLKTAFAQGWKNPKKAEILVPRIEKEVIESWKAALTGNQSKSPG